MRLATTRWAPPVLAALWLLVPCLARGYEAVEVRDGGRIAGRVTIAGKRPPRPPLEVSKNQDACGHKVIDETFLVSADGGVANVVVQLEGIERGKPADTSKPAVIDNLECRFQPHVQAMTAGQVLRIKNSDPILHNTHATFGEDETEFNLALPMQGQILPQKMKRPGIYRVRCDAGHVWMSAVIAVAPHPYISVTAADGSFGLDAVPPGKYRLRAWHEILGEKQAEVEVKAGAESLTPFVFSAP